MSDLRELWRRIVLGVLIRNPDDHLRNRGLLRGTSAGSRCRRPSTSSDPAPGDIAHLSTSIDGRTDEARLDVALEVCDLFRLTPDAARAAVREVAASTSAWRRVALSSGATPSQCDRMARAFDHGQAVVARDL